MGKIEQRDILRYSEKRQQSDDSTRGAKKSGKLVNRILIAAGTFFVGVGAIGIFVPLLPTTPFLLLAAACYARSSKRFYGWLLGNKWFGPYVKNYREGKGTPIKVKVLSISLLWVTIISSAILMARVPYVSVILILIAAGVTIHILRIRTSRR